MQFRSSIAISAALLFLGSAAAVYSPIGCGCQTPGDDFVETFAIPKAAMVDPRAPDVELVRKIIATRLKGHYVNLESLPGSEACSKLGSKLYRCTYWLWRAPGRDRGIEASVRLDDSGTFQSATVLPSLRVGNPAAPGATSGEDTET